MHLLLDTEAIEGRDGIPFDPNLRLEPPLGTKSDRLALVRGVKEGVLEAIAIDHTPFTYEEKTVAFADAPPGAIGLELALPLLWQGLVESGELSGLELWRALSSGPAGCLGLSLGAIAPNLPAEVILFDPQQTWTVSKQTIKSLSANTPWWGREIKGRVVCIN
jgi:dihydroorotase